MKIFYKIDFSEKDQKYVHITQTIEINNYKQKKLRLLMPVWSPGSYLIREYSKTLDCLRVLAEDQEISFEQISKNQWEIDIENKKNIQIKYRLYCNEFSVRTNFVDDIHALLIGPSTFLIPEDKSLCDYFEVEVDLPKDWNQIITGLETVKGFDNKFYSDNTDDFMDCPIESGNFDVYNFEMFDKPHRLAMIGNKVYEEEVVIDDIKKILNATKKVIGEIPYEHYNFITHLTSGPTGGIEHKNSTILHFNRWDFQNPDKYKKSWLSLVSHEYFHLWNVKRIKPVELSDFDYNKENYTSLLWMSEGFTSYFDDLILKRAGIYSNSEYLEVITDLINRLILTPGKNYQTVEQSSFDAWTKFYRKHENSTNQQISYYVKGAHLGLVLDLEIRKRTNHQKSLDHLMRMLWEDYKKDNSIGFTKEIIISYIEELAGDMKEIFTQFLETTEKIDYNKYLSYAGLRLKVLNLGKPTIDMDIRDEKGLFICSYIKDKGMAYQAGIMPGDEIIAIDGYRLTASNIAKRLKNIEVGDNLSLLLARDERVIEKTLIVGSTENDYIKVEMIENPSKEQQLFINEWLKVNDD